MFLDHKINTFDYRSQMEQCVYHRDLNWLVRGSIDTDHRHCFCSAATGFTDPTDAFFDDDLFPSCFEALPLSLLPLTLLHDFPPIFCSLLDSVTLSSSAIASCIAFSSCMFNLRLLEKETGQTRKSWG